MVLGCAFQPIIEKNQLNPNFGQYIKIDKPTNRNEFIIREHLYRLLDSPLNERYLLSFSTNILSTTGIITKEDQTTRYILNSTTSYSIKNIKTGRIIHSDIVFGTSSYSSNINTTSYSSDISKQNSIERLAKFTAEKIIAEIEISSVDWLKEDAIEAESN